MLNTMYTNVSNLKHQIGVRDFTSVKCSAAYEVPAAFLFRRDETKLNDISSPVSGHLCIAVIDQDAVAGCDPTLVALFISKLAKLTIKNMNQQIMSNRFTCRVNGL